MEYDKDKVDELTMPYSRSGNQSVLWRGKAEQEYRQFVRWSIGKAIWYEVRGQAILGKEEFADILADHLRKHRAVLGDPDREYYLYLREYVTYAAC